MTRRHCRLGLPWLRCGTATTRLRVLFLRLTPDVRVQILNTLSILRTGRIDPAIVCIGSLLVTLVHVNRRGDSLPDATDCGLHGVHIGGDEEGCVLVRASSVC